MTTYEAVKALERALGAASYPCNVDGLNERQVSQEAIRGLRALKDALETEQTMHAAWRKRAEEAESALMRNA